MRRINVRGIAGVLLLAQCFATVSANPPGVASRMDIGVPRSGFTVSGPGLEPYLGIGEADMVMGDIIGEAPCYGLDGRVIIVDVDPRRLAERAREFELCASGRMDPSTCYPDNRILPNHFIKGSLVSDGQNLTIELTLVDKNGNVKARESATGDLDDLFGVHKKVIDKLIKDLCLPIKVYTGTFSRHDVSVNSEYTSDLAGNIRWEFEEYDDIGGWGEYTGTGTADYTIKRIGCGAAATFSRVPVEGRLMVHDDKRYEFQIDLVGDDEQMRTCRREDSTWKETYSVAGTAMTSADPCGKKEFYPRYSDITVLSFGSNGSCDNVINRYQEGWSFKAAE
jgi:hypothetical protein